MNIQRFDLWRALPVTAVSLIVLIIWSHLVRKFKDDFDNTLGLVGVIPELSAPNTDIPFWSLPHFFLNEELIKTLNEDPEFKFIIPVNLKVTLSDDLVWDRYVWHLVWQEVNLISIDQHLQTIAIQYGSPWLRKNDVVHTSSILAWHKKPDQEKEDLTNDNSGNN